MAQTQTKYTILYVTRNYKLSIYYETYTHTSFHQNHAYHQRKIM